MMTETQATTNAEIFEHIRKGDTAFVRDYFTDRRDQVNLKNLQVATYPAVMVAAWAKPAGRLESSGSFNAMVGCRVRVTQAEEVDGELIGWLKQAYEAS